LVIVAAAASLNDFALDIGVDVEEVGDVTVDVDGGAGVAIFTVDGRVPIPRRSTFLRLLFLRFRPTPSIRTRTDLCVTLALVLRPQSRADAQG